MSPPSVVVTGAAGFVGRHVVAQLECDGRAVVAIAHRWSSIAEVRDRLDGVTVSACIHLGWYAEPGDYLVSVEGNRASLDDSLELVALLGERGCPHLVVAGSCAEYAVADVPLHESAPIAPASVYGAAKAALRLFLESSFRPAGMRVSWARLFNLTGPGEDARRLIPSVARAVLAGEPIALTSGEQILDYLDVADVAAALVALADAGAEGAFNVCSADPVVLRGLLTDLARNAGDERLLDFGGREHGSHDVMYRVGNNRRLRDATGWTPAVHREAMIDGVVGYWRATTNGDR